jgi:hypothetical protein
MDWIRAAIANAQNEGLTLQDIATMAEHAKTPQDFDRAVNELIRATVG